MLRTAYRDVAQVVAAALALTVAAPERAHAWTEARVSHVSAQLDATHPPSARVQLEIGVRVTGGWLSRFEVVGLDPDLTLATDAPPTLSAADGRTYPAQALSSESGDLMLGFGDKAAAPHRGEYVIHIAYDTRAPFNDGTVIGDANARAARVANAAQSALRVHWALPRWDVSLADVSVVVLAPAGSKAAPDAASRTRVDELAMLDRDDATQLTWKRVELPRTQSFEVAFDVPTRAGAAWSPTAATSLRSQSQLAWMLGLALGLLALLKRWLSRRSASRDQLQLVALLPLPSELLRSALVVAACAAGTALQGSAPVSSACLAACGIALALDRRFVRRPLPANGCERAASVEDLSPPCGERLRELAAPAAWLDATTPVGLVVLGLLHAPGLWLAARSGGSPLDAASCVASALLATPLFVTATRLSRPVGIGRVLHHLATLRATLRGLPVRTELLVHTTRDGRPCDARLRLVCSSVPAGMGKLELVVTDATFYGRPRWALCWLAQCRAHSSADSLLERALPDAQRQTNASGERIAYQSVTLDVLSDAEQLLGWLSRETPAQQQAA